MDAMEGLKVATVDIPGYFMQTYKKGTVFVKLTGVMVRLLFKINPGKYEKHIRWFRVEEVLCVILNKSLYGALLGAILFGKKLTKFIVEKIIFEINPYNWCEANKIISNIISNLNKEFGKEEPLTVNKVLVHEYLGMPIYYRK